MRVGGLPTQTTVWPDNLLDGLLNDENRVLELWENTELQERWVRAIRTQNQNANRTKEHSLWQLTAMHDQSKSENQQMMQLWKSLQQSKDVLAVAKELHARIKQSEFRYCPMIPTARPQTVRPSAGDRMERRCGSGRTNPPGARCK